MSGVSGLAVAEDRTDIKKAAVLLDVVDVTKEYETREGDEILALANATLSLAVGSVLPIAGSAK